MPSVRVWSFFRASGAALAGVFLCFSAVAQDAEQPRADFPADNLRIDSESLSRLQASQHSLRVPGDVEPTVLDRMEIADFEGRVLRDSIPAMADKITVNLPENGAVIARPKDLITMSLTSRRAVLPGGLIQADRTLPESDREAIWFRPTATASPVPATWDPEQGHYLTHLLLGLKSSARDSRLQPERPVVMRLGFRGMDAAPVEPLTLDKAGVEHDQRIRLAFRPTTDRPVVELRTDLGNYDLRLEVMPRLEVRPEADRMNGLGLETMVITVIRYGPDGGELPVSEPTEVFVETSGTRKITDRVVIPAGQSHADFRIRSSGLGAVQVRASAGGLEGIGNVQQQFPYFPVTASLLGGAIGGFCRRFRRKEGTGSRDLMRVIEGVLVAIVGYAVSVLGILQLGVPPAVAATEAGAFVTGVITGFLGVSVIESLTSRLGAVR